VSQVYWSFLWFAFVALWIGGTVAAIVHLVRRVHAPIWVIVLVVSVVLLIPFLTVALYWLVVAIVHMSRRKGPTEPARALDSAPRPSDGLPPPWPAPPPRPTAG
jgi:hypothetical protein